MTMNFDHLWKITPPWLLRTSVALAEFKREVAEVHRVPRITVHMVDGREMTTVRGIFQEFSTRLNFPSYFGANSAAFDECLTDLSWLPSEGYAIVIGDSENVLAREIANIAWLIDLLGRICEHWACDICDGEVWDRPAKPFHVLFQHNPRNASKIDPAIAALPVLGF